MRNLVPICNKRKTLKVGVRVYLRNRPLFLALIRAEELESFVRWAEFKGRVLDFGCGDGFFMKTLRKRREKKPKDAKIIGVEVDKKKAEEARRTGVYQEVVVYNGLRIPFADNHFDTVIANCVLEHVGGQELNKTLCEIHRVLKPGGRFYTTVMTKNWENYLLGNLVLGKIYQKWMRKIQKHSNLLTAEDWRKAFISAQFRPLKIVGYLDSRACRWMDFLHYVSIGSLISYKLFGRWVLFPWQYDLLPVERWLWRLIGKDVAVEKAGALFFVLEKKRKV